MNQHHVAPPRAIVIVAGGSGTRMGLDFPKQFWLLAGEPVLMHTIRRFYAFDAEMLLVVVLPANQITSWHALCQKHTFNIAHTVVHGGATRYESVCNGLAAVPDDSIAGIHDGVRPFVSQAVIARCYATAASEGSAIPVTEVNETLRLLEGSSSVWADRAKYRLVQTPQVFRASILKPAYKQPYCATFTDDAAVYESLGHSVCLVEGNRENIKLTTPEDLLLAEYYLANASQQAQ